MTDASRKESSLPTPALGQYRLRDLLLVMLGLGVLLGVGRALGGGMGTGEIGLLAMATISIGVAAVFLRRRAVWAVCLAASFFLPLLIVPAPAMFRIGASVVLATHFLFAGMPVLAVDPQRRRWPWVAAAWACQLAAALFTPSDAPSMIALAALFSWLLAAAALLWRYYHLPRHSRVLRSDVVPPRR